MEQRFSVTHRHEGALEKPSGVQHCRVAATFNGPEHRRGVKEEDGGDNSVKSVLKGDDEDGVQKHGSKKHLLFAHGADSGHMVRHILVGRQGKAPKEQTAWAVLAAVLPHGHGKSEKISCFQAFSVFGSLRESRAGHFESLETIDYPLLLYSAVTETLGPHQNRV